MLVQSYVREARVGGSTGGPAHYLRATIGPAAAFARAIFRSHLLDDPLYPSQIILKPACVYSPPQKQGGPSTKNFMGEPSLFKR